MRKNTIWVFTGNLSTYILNFLFGVILARLLLPEAFGIIVTISIFTGVFGLVSSGGMGEALVQAKEASADDFNIVFTTQFLICFFIYMVLYGVAPYFSAWFKNDIYYYLLPVSALNFLVRPFVNIQMATLRRGMKFKQLSIININSIIISSSSSILFAILGLDVWSLVFGGLVGTISKLIMLFVVTDWQPRFNFKIRKAKKLASYGLKNTSIQLISYTRKQLGNLIISRSLGPRLLGLFNKGDSLAQIPTMAIGGSTYQTVFRELSAIQDDISRSQYLYLQTITIVSFYTFPIFFGLIWLAKPFLYLVYGANWVGASFPLQAFCFAGLIRCFINPSGAVIAARDQLAKDIWLQIISLIILFAGIVSGAKWGLEGIIIGILPSILFYGYSSVKLACNSLGIEFKTVLVSAMPSLKLSMIMNVVLLFSVFVFFNGTISYNSWTVLICLSGLGAISYAGTFLFFTPKGLYFEAEKWKRILK